MKPETLIAMALTEALDQQREVAGLSWDGWAQASQVSRATIFRVMKAEDLKLSTLEKLAKGAGCRLEWRIVREVSE